MDKATPPNELVDGLQAGDPQAAVDLFARYAQRLTRLAEQHLSRKLVGRVDGEDIVQSVFRTFFRRSAQGEFRIDSSGQLWQLLVTITLRKTRAEGRHHTAACRTVAVELATGGPSSQPEAVAQGPGLDEAAVLVDEIESLLRGLPDLYCHILDLRLQGYSVRDIAPRLGVSRQTIYRALGLLQQRLGRGLADEPSPFPSFL